MQPYVTGLQKYEKKDGKSLVENFVEQCLATDTNNRLDTEYLLAHDWFKVMKERESQETEKIDNATLFRIRQYTNATNLQR